MTFPSAQPDDTDGVPQLTMTVEDVFYIKAAARPASACSRATGCWGPACAKLACRQE